MRAPTGEQYELIRTTPAGPARAVITQLAAGIREFQIGGVDLVEPFEVTGSPQSAQGIVLSPWPNRVRDGKWTWRGADGTETKLQLPLTEPAYGNASHGLLRFTSYELADKGADFVELQVTIYPQNGYPFLVDTRVRYELTDDGLTVTHTFANGGETDAPVAVGAHPYFRLGEVDTNELLLTVHATTHYELDEKMIPVGSTPVDGTRFDLRTPQRVGSLTLNEGYADAGPGELAQLTAPDGSSLVLWGDEAYRFVQVYTHRSFASLPEGGVALALEPMTAPTDAFNSGVGVQRLAPHETWSATWGVRYTPAA
ncbi:aldose 1-epimerase family protein [Gryllotalpicola reticulitermitis]|uniref:Aldose 1-epimerase family protein n=1 Tax=Gryllotalpicola reticulitermitis TaxID=1184153 RepID=A0ABV8Q4M7_9MICO